MNFVSWNCRGLGNLSKFEAVNDLIRMVSPDVLLLQETKIGDDILLSTISKKWKSKIGMVMGSRGTVGGIATLWTENVFTLEPSHITQHWLFSKLRHNPSQ